MEKIVDLTKDFSENMIKWCNEISCADHFYEIRGERGEGKTRTGVALAVEHVIQHPDRAVMILARNSNALSSLRVLTKTLIQEAEAQIVQKYPFVTNATLVARNNMHVTELTNGSQIRYGLIGNSCRGLTLSYIFADFEMNLKDERIKEFWVSIVPCISSIGGKIVSVADSCQPQP